MRSLTNAHVFPFIHPLLLTAMDVPTPLFVSASLSREAAIAAPPAFSYVLSISTLTVSDGMYMYACRRLRLQSSEQFSPHAPDVIDS